MSVAKLFDWFDAIQETTVNTNIGKARWKTETIERDWLFLTKLGVLKADYWVTIIRILGSDNKKAEDGKGFMEAWFEFFDSYKGVE